MTNYPDVDAKAELLKLIEMCDEDKALFLLEACSNAIQIRVFEQQNNAMAMTFFTSPKADGSGILASPVGNPEAWTSLDSLLEKIREDTSKTYDLFMALNPPNLN